MKQQLVFIDDSGDPGFKPHSSSYFVMACAIFMSDTVAEQVAEELQALRESKSWGDRAEFKFTKTRKAVIKELLETLPLKDARIRIDGRSSKEYMQKTSSYLRKELNKRSHKLLNVRFEDSSRNDLIQLADVIAGSINRSLQKDKTDSREYLAIIKPRVINITKIKLK